MKRAVVVRRVSVKPVRIMVTRKVTVRQQIRIRRIK